MNDWIQNICGLKGPITLEAFPTMKLGNETLFENHLKLIEGKNIGLLAHAASKDSKGNHILEKLLEGDKAGKWKMTAILAPEHGFKGVAQDMEPVATSTTKKGNKEIPIHSLYGTTFQSLSPTPEMLKGLDVLIVDLQDIGSRYYTYVNTMALCMRACRSLGISVVVCDRPNPINGVDVEGKAVEQDFRSFVGMFPLPVRHGRTIGELAKMFYDIDTANAPKRSHNSDLHIAPMTGWKREMFWDETGLTWTNPSPNMRSVSAALLYPGMCLLEGTNISEGRGTKTPFETIGAPWIDGKVLVEKLRSLKLEGIDFEAAVFTPTSRKFEGERCEGVSFTITDRRNFKPYLTGLALIHTIAMMYPKYFAWRREPYEFVDDIPAIDLLTGSSLFRKLVGKKRPLSEIIEKVYN